MFTRQTGFATFTKMILITFILSLVLCKCSTKSATSPDNTQSKGPLHPPQWLLGTWEGGSPNKLHLEFTTSNCFNSDGKEQFTGYTESTISDSTYALAKDNWTSIFQRISSTTIDWYVNNGILNNITRMTKK